MDGAVVRDVADELLEDVAVQALVLEGGEGLDALQHGALHTRTGHGGSDPAPHRATGAAGARCWARGGGSGFSLRPARLAPPCDIPSGCCFFTGPRTVTRSSLRMLRRVAAFCRPLQPVLRLVSFPRPHQLVHWGLCWLLQGSFRVFAAPPTRATLKFQNLTETAPLVCFDTGVVCVRKKKKKKKKKKTQEVTIAS